MGSISERARQLGHGGFAASGSRQSPTTGGDAAASLRDEPSKPVHPVLHVTGIGLVFLVPGLLISALVEWGYTDAYSNNEWPLLFTAGLCLVIGGVMWAGTQAGDDLRPGSVFAAVTATWVASSVLGALPFVMGNMFTWSQWDMALFEAISGFTCTGSTVLTEAHVLDNGISTWSTGRGVLLWRQMTQWYGGMGMVVLALTVLPSLGVSGLQLMSAEAPGELSDRLTARVADTAKRLWILYAGLTVVITLAYWATSWAGSRLGLYDAVSLALTTAATGGFSPNSASLGAYDSLLVEMIAVFGMLFAGINFALHYRALTGDLNAYRRSSDTMLYLFIVVVATIAATVINWSTDTLDFGSSLRHAIFNVASIITSTGYGSATSPGAAGDFVAWAPGALMVLLFLLIVGGNVGSTSGGLKVFRFQVAISHMVRSLQRIRHPRGVIPVKLGRKAIADDVVNRVLGFVTLYFVMAAIGTVVVGFNGFDPIEAAAASINALSNMGPGIGEAGPTGSFAGYPRNARLVLAGLMIVGRLELIAVVLTVVTVVNSIRHSRLFTNRL